MKVYELYNEVVSALDGNKYKESIKFGYPFLDKHRPSCRKKILEIVNKDDDYKWVLYEVRCYEVKSNDSYYKVEDVCKNCGHKSFTSGYHFEEDKMP